MSETNDSHRLLYNEITNVSSTKFAASKLWRDYYSVWVREEFGIGKRTDCTNLWSRNLCQYTASLLGTSCFAIYCCTFDPLLLALTDVYFLLTRLTPRLRPPSSFDEVWSSTKFVTTWRIIRVWVAYTHVVFTFCWRLRVSSYGFAFAGLLIGQVFVTYCQIDPAAILGILSVAF